MEQTSKYISTAELWVRLKFGLESKSRFVNFEALKSLMNERFRFQEAEVIELSPFVKKADK